jgi:NAD(P)-dependent dehydrogenase (short-subunit alcohol dehydrogenase family)
LLALGCAIARASEEKGVRCNVIAPGLMDTRSAATPAAGGLIGAVTVPSGLQDTGWKVAYAALFLISNESSYVDAPTRLLDGGRLAGIVRASPAISE